MQNDHFSLLAEAKQKGFISAEIALIIHNFYLSYGEAVEENGFHIIDLQPILNTFLKLVIDQLANPYSFAPFHMRMISPFNYYQFGLDLMRPLVEFSKSNVVGLEYVVEMEAALKRKENVIIFANHQTEPDPQAISLLLEKTHPQFAENIIFVAGHRVISDPLAVPFSKGRNLLCIFSKRHLEINPDLKQERLLHNQRVMKIMTQLLSEGEKCIYVAPSGGRDRPGPKGKIAVAPFDPQSIEMFRLIARQSGKETHFHPLALATYRFLPPPNSIEKSLGERRHAHCTPIHLAFGPKIDFDTCIPATLTDKKERRQEAAMFIWKWVAKAYSQLSHSSKNELQNDQM